MKVLIDLDLNVRPDFPVRTFQTASIDTINHLSTKWIIICSKDLDTNETLIEFDHEFTKLSCDSRNYFKIYMNGLQPERYYKILIQTEVSGSTIVKDDNYYLKL